MEEKLIPDHETFWRELDGEIVLLDLDSQTYYSTNRTGSLIWKAIQTGDGSVDSICEQLAREYLVERNNVKEHVERFIQELMECGLLKRRPQQ